MSNILWIFPLVCSWLFVRELEPNPQFRTFETYLVCFLIGTVLEVIIMSMYFLSEIIFNA